MQFGKSLTQKRLEKAKKLNRSKLGYIAIIMISLLPVAFLFLRGPTKNFADYKDLTHAIGQITALMGVVFFSLTFVLSTRLRFLEEIFGGLDKVYKVHILLGKLSLGMLFFHPLFLAIKFLPQSPQIALRFLSWSSNWSVNFGIIALIGMVFLIYLTYFSNLKYHLWKFSHEFMGLLFIFAVFHIFLVRDNAAMDIIFDGYYEFCFVVSAVGLLAFGYSFLLRRLVERRLFVVKDFKVRNGNVYDITFAPVGNPMKYRAGQFIFLSIFNKKVGREPHPFSLASASSNKDIRLMAKNLGDFTSRLVNVKKGDRAIIEGPYGRFFSDSPREQVWLAGGIGITPFVGMAEDMALGHGSKKVDLFYTVKEPDEYVYLEEFKKIAKANKGFRLHTKATNKEGYLSMKEVIELSGDPKDKEIFICGPEPFKQSMKKGFLEADVPMDRLHWEDFKFR